MGLTMNITFLTISLISDFTNCRVSMGRRVYNVFVSVKLYVFKLL